MTTATILAALAVVQAFLEEEVVVVVTKGIAQVRAGMPYTERVFARIEHALPPRPLRPQYRGGRARTPPLPWCVLYLRSFAAAVCTAIAPRVAAVWVQSLVLSAEAARMHEAIQAYRWLHITTNVDDDDSGDDDNGGD